MHTIYKYPIYIIDEQEISMPRGAHIFSFALQRGTPCVWAIVDPTEPVLEPKTLYLRGTGHELQFEPCSLRFIGTVLLNDGALVFHLFVPA